MLRSLFLPPKQFILRALAEEKPNARTGKRDHDGRYRKLSVVAIRANSYTRSRSHKCELRRANQHEAAVAAVVVSFAFRAFAFPRQRARNELLRRQKQSSEHEVGGAKFRACWNPLPILWSRSIRAARIVL